MYTITLIPISQFILPPPFPRCYPYICSLCPPQQPGAWSCWAYFSLPSNLEAGAAGRISILCFYTLLSHVSDNKQ